MKLVIIGDPRSPNLIKLLPLLERSFKDINFISEHLSDTHFTYRLYSLVSFNSPFVKKVATHQLSRSSFTGISALRFGHVFYHPFFLTLISSILLLVRILQIPVQSFFVRRYLRRSSPDLIIAYRTQVEGYLAALSCPRKYILFSQGADFIYYRDPINLLLVHLTLKYSSGLISDCIRDLHLAHSFGYCYKKPQFTLLGNGGISLIDSESILPCERSKVILCIRPYTHYQNYSVIFKAFAVLQHDPLLSDYIFTFVSPISLHPFLISLANKYSLNLSRLRLLPCLSETDFLHLLCDSPIVVSASDIDGIPVSLVEAMSCGAFPIATDIISIREVIFSGYNGLLFNVKEPLSLVINIRHAISCSSLMLHAHQFNVKAIPSMYSRDKNSRSLHDFLLSFVI